MLRRLLFINRFFYEDQKGNVAVLSAFFFMAMAGMMSLGIEASKLYIAKLQNQRAADIGNLAASLTESPIVGGAASAEAVATAANLVALNGLGGATVLTTAVANPSDPSQLALSTTVTRDIAMSFGGLLGGGKSNPVAANAQSAPAPTSGACIASLVGPTNIYGTSVVNGPNCSVAAKTFLYACGSTSITLAGASVGYSKSYEAPYLCKTATMTPGASAFTYSAPPKDVLAAKPGIVAIKTRLLAMGTPGWPYGSTSPKSLLNPTISSGVDKTFTSTTASLPQSTKYGKLTASNAVLTFPGTGSADATCATPTTFSGAVTLSGVNTLTFSSGCYAFSGAVVIDAGSTTQFAAAPGAAVTFVFKQYIKNGSGALTLPDAAYSFHGNVDNSSGGSFSVGAGLKVFGAGILNGTGSLSFGNGSHYVNGGTITNGAGTMSFANGPFYLWGGSMDNSTTGLMEYGNGPFYFYGGTIYNRRGTLNFGTGPFEFQGGSLTLSATSTTRFGVGDVNFYGGTISMAGLSTTFGYGGSATSGAGSVALYGGSLSLTTQNLTAVGVSFLFKGGTVSLLGIGKINATAPTGAAPVYGYRNILFVVYGGAFNLYQSNTTDTMSGLIYVPESNSSIYGSQTVNYPKGGCFQLVAGVVDIYQGARINFAPCAGLSIESTNTAPRLLR